MVVPTLDSALSWFYLLGNMSIQDFSNWDPVYFPLCPVGSLSTLTLSILESGYMTFCPCRSVPTIDSVNSGFCSRLVLSTWESVHLGIYLLRFSPLGSLATWHVAHVGLCPLLLLSPLDSAHVWFCFLGSLSNSVFVYFNSVHLGSLVTWHSACGSVYFGVNPPGWLSTWNLSTWESGHTTFFPRRIVSFIGSVQSGFC